MRVRVTPPAPKKSINRLEWKIAVERLCRKPPSKKLSGRLRSTVQCVHTPLVECGFLAGKPVLRVRTLGFAPGFCRLHARHHVVTGWDNPRTQFSLRRRFGHTIRRMKGGAAVCSSAGKPNRSAMRSGLGLD